TTPQRAVRAIRAGEEEIESGVSDPLVTRQRLSDIHSTGEQRWITLVNSSGQTHRRLIQVANFSGGRVSQLDIENDDEIAVRIHRIASVDPYLLHPSWFGVQIPDREQPHPLRC